MSSGKARDDGGGTGGDDRREDRRYRSAETGTLWVNGMPFDCTFENLSAGGALVEAGLDPLEGADVELEAASLGRVPAKIVHVRGSKIGLRFKREYSVDPDEGVPPRAAQA